MLWAIIENISLKLNGNRGDENLWKIWRYSGGIITLNEISAVLRKSRYLKGHSSRYLSRSKVKSINEKDRKGGGVNNSVGIFWIVNL